MTENREKTKIEELKLEEARMLGNSATQTRFTWAVIFLAFIAGLVGLLPMAGHYESIYESAFNAALSVAYTVLTLGLAYSFYSMCYSSYIIELITKGETQAVKDFLETHWHVRYTWIYCIRKNNEIKFRIRLVLFFSGLITFVSFALLFLKLGASSFF